MLVKRPMGWVGLGWVWVGLGWVGLGWVGVGLGLGWGGGSYIVLENWGLQVKKVHNPCFIVEKVTESQNLPYSLTHVDHEAGVGV